MLVAKCPHCGKILAIPRNKPKEFVCPYCDEKLALTYSDSDHSVTAESTKPVPAKAGLFSKIGATCKGAVNKTVTIAREHPAATITIAAAAIGAIGYLLFGKDKLDELLSTQSSSENNDTLGHEPDSISIAGDAQVIEGTSSDDSEEDEYTDWDILSYLGEHCRNCGASLAGAYYTDPWEDGDNECGYWTCPRCGAINNDWDSADDD